MSRLLLRQLESVPLNEHLDPTLFQLVRQVGPLGLFVLVLSVTSTLWLLASRVRGCFRPRPAWLARDLGFLFTGPATALLYSAIKAMAAAQSYVQGGLDAEFSLSYGLGAPIAVCDVALLGFAVGVLALALPAKRESSLA